MNQTFRDFSARCSNANDPSAILADLQSLSQQYTSLQNLPSPPGSSEPSSAIEVEQVSEPAEVVTFAHNTDHRMSNHQKPYQYRAEQPSRNSPIGIVSPTDTQSGRGSELHLISAVPRIETHGITPTPLSFMQSLEAPSSYSFGERTFARRLHRTSCEYAYRLACDPTRLPHLFNNVFRLTLQAAGSVDRVKYSLADTLSRGVKEPLNNWGATYIHIGGAGTHFPRSNDEGGSVYQPSDSWTITTVGPHKLVGRTMEEAVTADMLLRGTAGMDGEWFDAYDVEGYLVEKGIFLNPNSTFAEIELLDEQPTTPKSLPDSTLMGSTSYQMHSRAPAAFRSASELPASRSDLSDMRYTHFDASANSFTTKLPEQQPPSDNHGMVSRFDGLLYGTHTPSPIAVHPYQIQPPRGKSRFTIDIAEFCNRKCHPSSLCAGTLLIDPRNEYGRVVFDACAGLSSQRH